MKLLRRRVLQKKQLWLDVSRAAVPTRVCLHPLTIRSWKDRLWMPSWLKSDHSNHFGRWFGTHSSENRTSVNVSGCWNRICKSFSSQKTLTNKRVRTCFDAKTNSSSLKVIRLNDLPSARALLLVLISWWAIKCSSRLLLSVTWTPLNLVFVLRRWI